MAPSAQAAFTRRWPTGMNPGCSAWSSAPKPAPWSRSTGVACMRTMRCMRRCGSCRKSSPPLRNTGNDAARPCWPKRRARRSIRCGYWPTPRMPGSRSCAPIRWTAMQRTRWRRPTSMWVLAISNGRSIRIRRSRRNGICATVISSARKPGAASRSDAGLAVRLRAGNWAVPVHRRTSRAVCWQPAGGCSATAMPAPLALPAPGALPAGRVRRRRRPGVVSGFLADRDGREFLREILGLPGDLERHVARHFLVDPRHLAIGVGHHGGPAAVGLQADADVQRQRAQVVDAVVAGHLLAAVGAEDMLQMAAVAADMGRHVLDDAQDGHTHLLEHPDALFRVEQRNVLRRGDDHGACHRHALAQRELYVASAGRHVDDE